jgi:hypothetical protein
MKRDFFLGEKCLNSIKEEIQKEFSMILTGSRKSLASITLYLMIWNIAYSCPQQKSHKSFTFRI